MFAAATKMFACGDPRGRRADLLLHMPSNPNSLPTDAQLRAHQSRQRELRPGLRLHCEDGCDSCDWTAQAQIDTGLRLVVLLEGQVDVSYGLTQLALAHRGAGATAALVSVAEPEQFARRARQGVYSRRISLNLGPQWLAQAGGGEAMGLELSRFMHQHLATKHWQLSARASAIAEQIVHPPAMVPLLQHMYLESHVLELVADALGGLCAAEPPAAGMALLPREHQRLRELQTFLDSGQADALSLDAIARQVGINANSLQRQFRAVFGTTVFDYLREARLQRARQALERDGITVGQAAMVAGYTSAANFATAYRRRFGLAPKLARARL